MDAPKCELARIRTKDNIELHGLLFEPEKKTGKALVHVHAWIGNFYENRFINSIAEKALKQDIAFLTFNNRGTGIITDMIRRSEPKFEYVRLGGCLETFEDCIIDIGAAADFMAGRGYEKIILEGHSTGCQKITYYRFKSKDARVAGLVELSPADDVSVAKKFLGDKHAYALNIARNMADDGKGTHPVPEWMAFYPLLSARTFLSIADPKSASGRIFDYSGGLEELKNANCPVLVAFGSKDEYEPDPKGKIKILKKEITGCSARLFAGADHWFSGHEGKLSDAIAQWVREEAFHD